MVPGLWDLWEYLPVEDSWTFFIVTRQINHRWQFGSTKNPPFKSRANFESRFFFFLIFDLWKWWSIFGAFGPWIPVVWDEIGGLVDPTKPPKNGLCLCFRGSLKLFSDNVILTCGNPHVRKLPALRNRKLLSKKRPIFWGSTSWGHWKLSFGYPPVSAR